MLRGYITSMGFCPKIQIYLTKTLQKCQGHDRQGKTKELETARETWHLRPKFDVGSWTESCGKTNETQFPISLIILHQC